MEIIGEAENVVMQHGGIRAIHGWLETSKSARYICIFGHKIGFLFKIIYTFDRTDLAEQASAKGFLAEIVYGSDEMTAQVPRPGAECSGVALCDAGEPAGLIYCGALVTAAIEATGTGT